MARPSLEVADIFRYTHRIAIANSRLISLDGKKVTFKWKDTRAKDGDLHKTIALPIPEFIRRFLIHLLPQGFHRIRHGACPGLDPGASSPMAGAPATSPVPANCSACRPPRPATVALGSSPPRAPGSPSQTRQRHYKVVANLPRRWRRWPDPWHPADLATPGNHLAAVKSP